MGMDVFGKNATSTTGNYFRNSIWGWGPLAQYLVETFPDLTSACEYWGTNDGDGLDAHDSQQLAVALDDAINSGATQRYADQRAAALKALPDEPCRRCNGGREYVRNSEPCSTCDGTGKVRPFVTQLDFTVDNVRNFAAFLHDCGGFEIL